MVTWKRFQVLRTLKKRLMMRMEVLSVSPTIQSRRRMASTWSSQKSHSRITSVSKRSTTINATGPEIRFPTLITRAIVSAISKTRLFASCTLMLSSVGRMSCGSLVGFSVVLMKLETAPVSCTTE